MNILYKNLCLQSIKVSCKRNMIRKWRISLEFHYNFVNEIYCAEKITISNNLLKKVNDKMSV